MTGSHDRSVEAVAEGLAAGAAVDSLVYEQMKATGVAAADRVRVVAKSEAFGMPPVVVHPKVSRDVRQALVAALLDMHEDPQGQSVLVALGIERFVVPAIEDYEKVRRMAQSVDGE